jgi:hypothetical protein
MLAEGLDPWKLEYTNHAAAELSTRALLMAPLECRALASLYECRDFADVTIISKDQTERICHACVIIISSPVFKAMLTCGMMESTTRCITLPETTAKVIDVFLKLAYGIDAEFDLALLDDLIAFGAMYDVSAIRHALGDWLQIPTDDAPRQSKKIKRDPLGIEQAWFLLKRHATLVDLLRFDASKIEPVLKVTASLCNARLQFLAFHQPFLRQSLDNFTGFMATLVKWLPPKPYLLGNIDPSEWFRFDLICRWIKFDADERAPLFEQLVETIRFNRMTKVQIACALRHPLVRANSKAFIRITDAFVSQSGC